MKKALAISLAAFLSLFPSGPAATAWAGMKVEIGTPEIVPVTGSAATGAASIVRVPNNSVSLGGVTARMSPAASAPTAFTQGVATARLGNVSVAGPLVPNSVVAPSVQTGPALGTKAAASTPVDGDGSKTGPSDAAPVPAGDHASARPGAVDASKIKDVNFDQSAKRTGDVADPVAAAAVGKARRAYGLKPAPKNATVEVFVRKSPEGSEAEQLARLNAVIAKRGYPPLSKIVRQKAPVDRPTVSWLVNASQYKAAIAEEGGRQSPKDWHMVLDASWFLHEVTTPDGKKSRVPLLERDLEGRLVGQSYRQLWMTKGVAFDEKGAPYLIEYKTPRRVGHFADFFTMAANNRVDGAEFQVQYDGPMSSDDTQLKWYKDKFLTTLLAAREGGGVPVTLGLVNPKHPALVDPFFANQHVAEADHVPMPGSKAEIRAQVVKFLATFRKKYGYDLPEVAVKPSGAYFRSARGVELIKSTEIDKIVEHIWALKGDPHMLEDGAVILSERLEPPPVYFRTGGPYKGVGRFAEVAGQKVELIPLTLEEINNLPPNPDERNDWNMRVFVARTPTDQVRVMGTFVRAGPWGGPTNAEPDKGTKARPAAVVSYEDLMYMLRTQNPGLMDTAAQRHAFEGKIRKIARAMLNGIQRHDDARIREENEPYRSKVIFIGLDVMAPVRNGELYAATIESNGHDSGGQTQVDDHNPANRGSHSRAMVARTFAEARREELRGKRIVLVGDGYDSKRFIFEKAQKLGIKVVLIAKPGSWAEKYASEYIPLDTTKPDALEKAKAALRSSIKKNGPIDGITSFWEADMVLTGHLAAAFNKPMHDATGIEDQRDKARSAARMKRAGFNVARTAEVLEPKTRDAAELRRAHADLLNSLDHVGYPALLKLKHGAAAAAMRIVSNKAEALAAYDHMINLTPAENNNKHHGDDVVVVQVLDGIEFDADGPRQKGRTRALKITDNWPVDRPYTLATGSSSPSRALTEKQKALAAETVNRAADLFKADNGIIHYEGMVVSEPDGDKVYLFDTGPRVGGHYVPVWFEKVWDRDLIEDMFLIAAGIDVGDYIAEEPMTYLEGPFITPKVTGVVEKFELTEKGRNHPGLIELERFVEPGQRYSGPPLGVQRLGMLHVQGDSPEEAQRNREEIEKEIIVKIRPDAP